MQKKNKNERANRTGAYGLFDQARSQFLLFILQFLKDIISTIVVSVVVKDSPIKGLLMRARYCIIYRSLHQA